ncbi:MAG: hypothetical protein LDL24_01035 [Treponema sp.]|nr:hypothetical protein [Treponema sp.]
MGSLRITGLETLKSAYRNLSGPNQADWKKSVLYYLEGFVRYNTLEISIPVLRDPALAPEGHTGLICSILLDYELCRMVKEAGWFDEFRLRLEDLLLDVMEAKLYPDLKEHLVDRFSITPLSIEQEVGSSGGAITGWSFEEGPPPVVHEMGRIGSAVHTPAPGVFQAGQWTYSPSGVPIALLTGKLAADAIKKDLRP